MKEQVNKVIACIVFFLQISFCIPAQTVYDLSRTAGLGRLEVYLDRAQQERSVESWRQISEEGLVAALAEWEYAAVHLRESSPGDWHNLRAEFIAQTKIEQGRAYAQWLSSSYLEESALAAVSLLGVELRSRAAQWQYEDDDGEHESVLLSQAADARQQWREKNSSEVIEKYLSEWDKKALAIDDLDILLEHAGVTQEAARHVTGAIRESYRIYVRAEYVRVAQAEENVLMKRLLYDQKSLKKMSEAEAARVITAEIAERTKNGTTSAIDELFELLNTEFKIENIEGVTIDMERWLESFSAEFKKGIGKWEAAEKEFLIARFDWEKNAEELFRDGEESWTAAFAELRTKKQEWQKDIQTRLDEGLARWQAEETELGKVIKQAQQEFAVSWQEREKQLTVAIDVQTALYNHRRQMVEMAFEGIEFWHMHWSPKYKGTYFYWKTEAASEPDNAERDRLRSMLLSDAMSENWTEKSGRTELEQQAVQWKNADAQMIQREYYKKIRQIETIITALQVNEENVFLFRDQIITQRERLRKLQQFEYRISSVNSEKSLDYIETLISDLTAIENFSVLQNCSESWKAQTELVSWLFDAETNIERTKMALENILSQTAAIFTDTNMYAYIDELDVELIKAKIIRKYWDDEAAIARVVNNYAENRTSTAETQHETQENMRYAVQQYENALVDYENEVKKLETLIADCNRAEVTVVQIKNALNNKIAEIELARKNYAVALEAYRGINESAVKNHIASLLIQVDNRVQNDQISLEENNYYRVVAKAYAAYNSEKANSILHVLLNGNNADMGAQGLQFLSENEQAAKRLSNTEITVISEADFALIPTELAALEFRLREQYERFLLTSNEAEKAELRLIIAAGFYAVESYWHNKRIERESTVRFILSGTTGLESFILPEDKILAVKQRAWLETQHAILEINTQKTENAAEKQKMLDQSQEIAALLALNTADLYTALYNLQESVNPLRILLQKKLLYENNSFEQLASELYEAKLLRAGFIYEALQQEIIFRYAEYSNDFLLERSANALNAVRELITQKNNAIPIMSTATILAYLADIQEAAAGLDEGNRAAVQNYITGVMEYCAASRSAENFTQLSAAVASYEEIASSLNTIAGWKNALYDYERFVQMLHDSEFQKQDAVFFEAAGAHLANMLVEKTVKTKLLSCVDEARALAVITENAALSGIDEKVLKIAARILVDIGFAAEAEITLSDSDRKIIAAMAHYSPLLYDSPEIYALSAVVNEDNPLNVEEQSLLAAALRRGYYISQSDLKTYADNLKLDGFSPKTTELILRQNEGLENLSLLIDRLILAQAHILTRADLTLLYAQFLQNEQDANSTTWVELAKLYAIADSEGLNSQLKKNIAAIIENNSVSLVLDEFKTAYITTANFLTDENTIVVEPIVSLINEELISALLETIKIGGRYAISIDFETAMNEFAVAQKDFFSKKQQKKILLGRMHELFDILKSGQTAVSERLNAVNAAQLHMTTKQQEYDTIHSQYLTVISNFEQPYQAYNAQVTIIEEKLTVLDAIKLNRDKNQAVHDWAISVYLENIGSNSDGIYKTPREKLTEAEYGAVRARAAENVLRTLRQENDDRTFIGDEAYEQAYAEYEKIYKKRFFSRALQFETQAELERMKEATRAAEIAEREALAVLVTDMSDVAGGLTKADITDLNSIRLVKNGDTYTLSLANGTPSALEDLRAYFEESVCDFELVDGTEQKSRAAVESFEWLRSLYARSDAEQYLTKLGIAYTYMRRMKSTGYAPPTIEETANALKVWNKSSFQGNNIAAAYEESYMQVLWESYSSITTSEQGQQDLAKYILYRSTNLRTINLPEREENEIAIQSLQKTAQKMTGWADSARTVAILSGIIAAGFFAGAIASACFLNFGLAAVLTTIGALYLITAALEGGKSHGFFAAAQDLSNYATQRADNKFENGLNYVRTADYANWQQTANDLHAKKEKVALYYGKTTDNETFTYEKFSTSVQAILDTANSGITAEDFREHYSHEVFVESGASDAAGTFEALDLINIRLASEENRLKAVLIENHINPLKIVQNEKSAIFTAKAFESLTMNPAMRAQLAELALGASNEQLSVQQRKEASESYERLVSSLNSQESEQEIYLHLLENARNAFGIGIWRQRTHDRRMLELEQSLAGNYTNGAKITEPYAAIQLDKVKSQVFESLNHAFAAQQTVKNAELQVVVDDFYRRSNQWKEQLNRIMHIADGEWSQAQGTLNESYKAWYENFMRAYKSTADEWIVRYEDFTHDKQQWINEQYVYSINVANTGLMRESGNNVDEVIAASVKKAFEVTLPEFKGRFTVSSYVEKILSESALSGLFTAFSDKTAQVDKAAPIRRGVQKNLSGAQNIAGITLAIADINTELKNMASKLAAIQAREQFESIKAGYQTRIEQENKAVEASTFKMVRENGYSVTNTEISRNALVDATLFQGGIRNKQTVHKYRYFTAPDTLINTDFAYGNDNRMSNEQTQLLIAQAWKSFNDYEESIFGKRDATGKYITYTIPRSIALLTGEAYASALTDSENDQTQTHTDLLKKHENKSAPVAEKDQYLAQIQKIVQTRGGKLSEHIGFAPEFKWNSIDPSKSRAENLAELGKGEIGLVMLDFHWNNIIEGKGVAQISIAGYDQRIFDADFAPTINFICDIAISIAANSVNPLAGMLMSMVKNLFVAGLDVSNGFKTADQVGKDLAIKTASSVISLGGGYAGTLTNVIANSGQKIMLDMLIETGTKVASKSVGDFLQSVNFDQIGTDNWFDSNSFTQKMGKWDDWGGIIGSVLGKGLNTSMTMQNLGQFKNGIYELVAGFNKTQVGSIASLNSLAGGLLSTAATFALTGNSMVNLAGINGVGLLEFHFGTDGFNLQLGMNGTDISIKNVLKATQGIKNWQKNTEIQTYAGSSNMNSATALRTQWGYGDAQALQQLESILTKQTKLESGGSGSEAETVLQDGIRIIFSNKYGENLSLQDQYMLGLVLQHEAYRDGIVGDDQQSETQNSAFAHTKMMIKMIQDGIKFNLNSNLLQDLIASNSAKGDREKFNAYVDATYDKSADYWKVLQDGSIFDDGKDGTISFEDGRETIYTNSKGKQGSLEEFLGLEAKTGYQLLMKDANFAYNSETKTWSGGNTIDRAALEKLIQSGTAQNNYFDSLLTNQPPQTVSNNPFAHIATAITKGVVAFWDSIFGKKEISPTMTHTFDDEFTLNGSADNTVLVKKITSDNATEIKLLSQHDTALSSIPAIKKDGCNFMVVLGYVQMLTGQTFSAEQVIDIWNESVQNKSLDSNGYINSANVLADSAFSKLGRADIGLNFDVIEQKNTNNAVFIGNRVQMFLDNGKEHFTLGNVLGDTVYNPGNSNVDNKIFRGVWVYAK